MIRWLRWLHLYAALIVAVPLLLLFISGTALVYKADYWHWQHPQLDQAQPALSAADHARALAAIRQRFDAPVNLVKLPQPAMAAYQVWLADGREALVSVGSHRVIDHWAWWQRPTSFLAELHLHLLAGETGSRVIGWLGITLLLLIISGAIVWWPQRRRFRWHTLTPRNTGRGALLMFHRNLGILTAPLALLLIAAGTGVAFFQPTRVLLNGLFGDADFAATPIADKPQSDRAQGEPLAMATLLARARTTLPQGRITFVYPDHNRTGVLTVRKKMPQEPHPNGLSFLHIDTAIGEVLKVIDASTAPPGDRIANWLYPLHAAKWGGRPWQIIVVFNGVILTTLLLAGTLAWLRKPRQKRASAATTKGA